MLAYFDVLFRMPPYFDFTKCFGRFKPLQLVLLIECDIGFKYCSVSILRSKFMRDLFFGVFIIQVSPEHP